MNSPDAVEFNNLQNVPKTRIELHAHLDGCMRHETIWELLKEKNIKMPGNGTFKDLKKALVVRDPVNLGHFLAPFGIFLPAVQDDFNAMERIAYEFCEDKAEQNVLYVEARYNPHAFLTEKNTNRENLDEVVAAIHRGFIKGEKDFNIKVGTILCLLRGTDKSMEVFDLYRRQSDKGLLGLDMAAIFSETSIEDEVPLNTEEQKIFERAERLHIHRTIHASERGPPEMAERALYNYRAERIGHGYRVLENNKIYRQCIEENVHFECCPWSSYLTGSVPLRIKKHPIAVFSENDVNFSINTDDTAVTGYSLTDDYNLTQKWGFTEGTLIKCNFNAARATFLPVNEKEELIRTLKKNIGIE